ncbi:MAG: ABC transporter permease [Oscillospiraceae bacterium]
MWRRSTADDDYGKPDMDSHWARLGDRITLRYVEEYEYYNPNTGEVYGEEVPEGEPFVARAVQYRDVEYEVAALVTVPMPLSYRYYGTDEFVMNDQTFLQDTGTDCIMAYAFDTTEEANAGMERFLADYTQNQHPQCDYESKATYAAEFESFRAMFLLLGGVLSIIVGLVGVLNFFNAILTGIITRRREFAVLQSIGMTGRQLRRMLVYEGLLYALGSLAASLLISFCAPAASQRPGACVLVLHLPVHHLAHPDSGAGLCPAGQPDPAGSLPHGFQDHHCRAVAGGRSSA